MEYVQLILEVILRWMIIGSIVLYINFIIDYVIDLIMDKNNFIDILYKIIYGNYFYHVLIFTIKDWKKTLYYSMLWPIIVYSIIENVYDNLLILNKKS